MIYDAGQNSHRNHALIEESGIGFVGSLPPSDHPGLLAIRTADHQAPTRKPPWPAAKPAASVPPWKPSSPRSASPAW